MSSACFGEICTELLRSGQTVRFQATGASMAPSVLDGDRLTIEPVDATQVRPEDIVFYSTARGLTAHRVVERLTDGPPSFRARGDAPGSDDEMVSAGQLLGRVTLVERAGRSCPLGRPLAGARIRSRIAVGLRAVAAEFRPRLRIARYEITRSAQRLGGRLQVQERVLLLRKLGLSGRSARGR